MATTNGATATKATTKKASKTEIITIPGPDIQVTHIRIVGTARLVCHQWGEKAKQQMRERQGKKATRGRAAKDPEQDFRDSLYPHPDGGYGFPAIAFKNAAVTACTQVDGMTKVFARGAFHVLGDLVKIDGDEPVMREDMVRVGMGTADLRYRGSFEEWSASIPVRYNASVISLEQLYNLFQLAGFSVGVGEWRAEKNGDWGMWELATD